jgi:hypothetical protein
MMRTRAARAAIVLALAALGCRHSRASDLGMADTTFVSTMGELRRASTDTTLDPTMRDSTRRLILRRHKVTSVQLEHAARRLADSPTRASDLWRKIETPPRAALPGRPSRMDTLPPPPGSHPMPHP